VARRKIRYYSPKRRAIYSKGDEIDSLVLFRLFDWKCILCGEKIDPRRRCPDWKAATIEHLKPISRGGTHTWDNVAPAHLKCNMDKGDLNLDLSPVILNV